MHLFRIHVPSGARAQGFLPGLCIVRVGVCDGAMQDKMCSDAAVLVWRVVGIPGAEVSVQWSHAERLLYPKCW